MLSLRKGKRHPAEAIAVSAGWRVKVVPCVWREIAGHRRVRAAIRGAGADGSRSGQMDSSACATSATMSSPFSMPTDRRTKSGLTPAATSSSSVS